MSGAGDKTIRIWDLQSEKLEKTLKAPRGVLCLQFDEQKIVRQFAWHINKQEAFTSCVQVSGYMDNTIVIWDINEGKRINTVRGHLGTWFS